MVSNLMTLVAVFAIFKFSSAVYRAYPGFSGGYGLPAQFNSNGSRSFPMQCFDDALFSGTDENEPEFLPRAASVGECDARLYPNTKLSVDNTKSTSEPDVSGQCICGSQEPEITGQRLTGSAATSDGQIVTNGVCDRVEIGWAWPAGSALNTECDDPSQRDDRCLNPIVLGLYSRKPQPVPAGSSTLFGFTTGDDNHVDDFRKDGAWAYILQSVTPQSEAVLDGFEPVNAECGTVYEDPLAGDSTGQGNADDESTMYRLPSAVPAGLYCDAAGGRGGQLNLGSAEAAPPPPPPPTSGAGGEEDADESRRRWYSQARTEGSNFDRGAAFSSRPSERGWTGLDVENMARFDVDCHCRGGLLQAMFSHAGIFLDNPISTLFPHLEQYEGDLSNATAMENHFSSIGAEGHLSAAYSNYVNTALGYFDVDDITTAFSTKREHLVDLYNEDESIATLLSGSSSRKLKGCSESMVFAGLIHVFLKMMNDPTIRDKLVSIHDSIISAMTGATADPSSTEFISEFKLQLALMQVAVEPQSDCSECGAGNAFYVYDNPKQFLEPSHHWALINLFLGHNSLFDSSTNQITDFATLFGDLSDGLLQEFFSSTADHPYNDTDFALVAEDVLSYYEDLGELTDELLYDYVQKTFNKHAPTNPIMYKSKPMQSFSQLLHPLQDVNASDAPPPPAPPLSTTPQGFLSVLMNSFALYLRSAVYHSDPTLLAFIMSEIDELQGGLDSNAPATAGDSWSSKFLANGFCVAQDFMNNPFFFGATIPYAKFQHHVDQTMPVVGGLCKGDCDGSCLSTNVQQGPFTWDYPANAIDPNGADSMLGYSGCYDGQRKDFVCRYINTLPALRVTPGFKFKGPSGNSYTISGGQGDVLFYINIPATETNGMPCCNMVVPGTADDGTSTTTFKLPVYGSVTQAGCYWDPEKRDDLASFFDITGFGIAQLWADPTAPFGSGAACKYGGCGRDDYDCCSDDYRTVWPSCGGHHGTYARCKGDPGIFFDFPRVTCSACPTLAEVEKLFPNNQFSKACQAFGSLGFNNVENSGGCFRTKLQNCNACGTYSQKLSETVGTETGNVPARVNMYFQCLATGCRTPDSVDEYINCTTAAPFGYLASQRASIFSPASEPPIQDAASSQPSENAKTCGRRDLFEQLATPIRVLDLNEALAVQDRPWWSDLRPPVGTGETGNADSVGGDGSGQQESADAWRQTGNQLASTGTFPWLTGSVCAGDQADPSFFNKSTLALIYGGYGPQCTRNQPTNTNIGQIRKTTFVGEGCPYGFQQTYVGSQFMLYNQGSVYQSQLFRETFASSETIRGCPANWFDAFYSADLNVPRKLCYPSSTTPLLPFQQEMTDSSGSSTSISSLAGSYECLQFGTYLEEENEYYRTIGEYVGRHIFGLTGPGSLYPTPSKLNPIGTGDGPVAYLEASANVSNITSSDFVPRLSRLHQVVGNFARHPYRAVPPPPSPSPPPPGIMCAVTYGNTAAHQITAANFQTGLDGRAWFPSGGLGAGLPYTEYRDDSDNGVVYSTSADWASGTLPDTSGPFQMCVTYMTIPDNDPLLIGQEPPNLLFYGLPFTLAPFSSESDAQLQEGCYFKRALSDNANSRFLVPYYSRVDIVFCVCYSTNCTDDLNPGILNATLDGDWTTYSDNYERVYNSLNTQGFGTSTPHYVPVNISTFAITSVLQTTNKDGDATTTSEPIQLAYLPFNYHLLERFTEGSGVWACGNILDTSQLQSVEYECCCGLAVRTCADIPANETCTNYCNSIDPGLQCSYSAANFGTTSTSHECFWDRSTLGVYDGDESATALYEAWCPGTCFGERVSAGVPLWASTSWCGPNPGTMVPTNASTSGDLAAPPPPSVLFPGKKYTFGYGLGERQQNIFAPDSKTTNNSGVFSFTTKFDQLGLHTQPSFLHGDAASPDTVSQFFNGRTIDAITRWTTNGDFGSNHPAACWYSRRGIVNDMTDSLFGVCPAEQSPGETEYSCWWTAWPGTSRSTLGCSDPGVFNRELWSPMNIESDETTSPMHVFTRSGSSGTSKQVLDETGDPLMRIECFYRGPGSTVHEKVEQVACKWTFPEPFDGKNVSRVPVNAPAWWSGALDSSRRASTLRIGVFGEPPAVLQATNSTENFARECSLVGQELCSNNQYMMGIINNFDRTEFKTISTDDATTPPEPNNNFYAVSHFNCTAENRFKRFKYLCAPHLCDVGVGRYLFKVQLDTGPDSGQQVELKVCGDDHSLGAPLHLTFLDNFIDSNGQMYNFTADSYEDIVDANFSPHWQLDCAMPYDDSNRSLFQLAGTLVGVEMRSVRTVESAEYASDNYSTTSAPVTTTSSSTYSQPGRAHANGESVTFYSSLLANNFYPPGTFSSNLPAGWDLLTTPTKSGVGDLLSTTYAVCFDDATNDVIIPWFAGGHTAMFTNPSGGTTITSPDDWLCAEPDTTAAQHCIFTPVFSAGVFSTLTTKLRAAPLVVRRGGGRQTDASMCVAAPFAVTVNNEDKQVSIEAVASVEFPGWLADTPIDTINSVGANLDAPPISLSEAGLNDWCGLAKSATDCNLVATTTTNSSDGFESRYNNLPRRHRICQWLPQTASQPDRTVGKFVVPDIDVSGGDSDDSLTGPKQKFLGKCVLSRKIISAIGSANDDFSEASVYAPRCAEILLAFGDQIPISACGGGTAGFTGCVPTLTTVGTTIRSSDDLTTGLFSTTFPGSSTQAQLDTDPESPHPVDPSSSGDTLFALVNAAYFTVRVDTENLNQATFSPITETDQVYTRPFEFSSMDCVGCYESTNYNIMPLPQLENNTCTFDGPVITAEYESRIVKYVTSRIKCEFKEPVLVIKYIEYDTDSSSPSKHGLRNYQCLADNQTDESRCNNPGEVSHLYGTITSLSIPTINTAVGNNFTIVASKFIGFEVNSSASAVSSTEFNGPAFLTDRTLLTCVPIATRVRVDPSTTNFLVSVGNVKKDFPVDCSRLAALGQTVLRYQYNLASVPPTCTMAFLLPLNKSATSNDEALGVYHELFDTTPVLDSSSGQIQLSLHDTLQDIGLVSSVGKRSGWHRMLGLYRRKNRGVHWVSDPQSTDGVLSPGVSLFPDIESFTGKSLDSEILITVMQDRDASAASLYNVPNCRHDDDPSRCYVMMDKKAYYPCTQVFLAPTPTVTCTKPTFQYMFPEGSSGLQYNIPLSLCRTGSSCTFPTEDEGVTYGATIGAWTLGATGVHYCDNYLERTDDASISATDTPDNFYFYSNSTPVKCSGDPYDTPRRIQFCQNQKPWYVLGGFVLNDFGIEQLCPWLAVNKSSPVAQTQECFIFPDGRYNSISLILGATLPDGLTFSGTTFRYVPFSQAALRRLLVSARVYNTMFTLDLVERISKPLSESELLATGFIAFYNQLFNRAGIPSSALDGVCGIDNAILDVELMVSVEKLLNAAVTATDSDGVPTEYTLPMAFRSGPIAGASATSNPMSFVMTAAEVRPRFAETAISVAYEDIKITTAVPRSMYSEARPVIIGTPLFVSRFGIKVCTRLEIDGSNIQIYELTFNQTGCAALGATETTPIVFSGASCVASVVHDIVVVDSSTAVGVLGADASFYRYSPTINSSFFRVYNVHFEYTTQRYQAGRNIIAVLGRATGAVEISGQCRADSAPATTSPGSVDYFEPIGSGCWATVAFDHLGDKSVPGLCVGRHDCIAPGYPGGCCSGPLVQNVYCDFGFSCGDAAGSDPDFANVGCRISQCESGQAHVVDVADGSSNFSDPITLPPTLSPRDQDNPVPSTISTNLHKCNKDAPGLCSPRCTSGYSEDILLPSGFQFEVESDESDTGQTGVADRLYGALQQWQRKPSTGELGLGRFRISVGKSVGPTNERINLPDLHVRVQTDSAEGPKMIVHEDGGPAVIDMSESDSRGYVHGINAFVNTTLLRKNFLCLDVHTGDRTLIVPNLCNETILRFRIDKSNNHVHPFLVNETVTGAMVGQGDRGRCLTSFLKTPKIEDNTHNLGLFSTTPSQAQLYVLPCEPCSVGEAFGGLGDVYIEDEKNEQALMSLVGVWIYAGDKYYLLGNGSVSIDISYDSTEYDLVLRFGKYNFLTLLIKIDSDNAYQCYFEDGSYHPCAYSSTLRTQRIVSDDFSLSHKMYLDNLVWMYFGGSPLMRLGFTDQERAVCSDFDGPFFVQNEQLVGAGAIVQRTMDGLFEVKRGGGGFISGLSVDLYQIPEELFDIVSTQSFGAQEVAQQFYNELQTALEGSRPSCKAVAITQSVLIQPVNETSSEVVGSAINLINVSQWTSYFSAAYEKRIYSEPTSYTVIFTVSNIVLAIGNAMLLLLHFVFVFYGVELRKKALEKSKID